MNRAEKAVVLWVMNSGIGFGLYQERKGDELDIVMQASDDYQVEYDGELVEYLYDKPEHNPVYGVEMPIDQVDEATLLVYHDDELPWDLWNLLDNVFGESWEVNDRGTYGWPLA